MDQSPAGLVLLIGSGRRQYREYLMEGASRHQPLWLIDEKQATWQRRYIVGSSVVEYADSSRYVPDQQGLVDSAVQIAQAHRVGGVFTYDEMLVVATAHIADRLGLPGLTAAGADHCRNKHLTRQALTAAGLPQPRFAPASTWQEADRAAAAIGYPVVVKPRGCGASIGVVRADDARALPAAFGVAERAGHQGPVAYEGEVLIEELIDGSEISIDASVVAGEYLPFCIARKRLGPPPYFEEVGHIVDGADPLYGDAQLHEVLSEAHRALGVRYGVTHTEVKLSSRGMVIIEVNGRLAGDLVPYLAKLATGVDAGRILVDVALGLRPSLEPEHRRCAGIRLLYPPEDCRVVDIAVPDPGAVPGLVAAQAMVEPGATVLLPPRAHVGRYAYVICTADDPTACAARLAAAADLVELKYESESAPERGPSR